MNKKNKLREQYEKCMRDGLFDAPDAVTDRTTLLKRVATLENCLMSHEAVTEFWRVWTENGEPHKHGVYESTWMAFRAAFKSGGKIQLAAVTEVAKLKEKADALQAKIDMLMLEYCPEEMTEEQKREWARHQVPVSEATEAAIEAALEQGE